MLADDTLVNETPTFTAIVTGGASGVGKATCELLARVGYLVAVADRDELGARAVADACGGLAFAVDLSDESSVATTFARAYEALGERLDGLVTTAAIWDGAPFLDTSGKTFRALGDLNVLGTYLSIRVATRLMKRGARICTVAGTAASHDKAESAADCAARGAVLALTRGAAAALAERGIAANGVEIAPGGCEPEGIAEAIVWLISPRAAHVNGAIVTVAGALPS